MAAMLSDDAIELLDAKNFVVFTTVNPDGSPQSSVMWAKHEDGDVLLSTAQGRQKHRNLERDPRASLVVYDPANPYRYVEVRGEVSMTTEGGRELIDDLSRAYQGEDYPEEPEDVVRVVLRLTPRKVIGR